jgi:hypothetical protein
MLRPIRETLADPTPSSSWFAGETISTPRILISNDFLDSETFQMQQIRPPVCGPSSAAHTKMVLQSKAVHWRIGHYFLQGLPLSKNAPIPKECGYALKIYSAP